MATTIVSTDTTATGAVNAISGRAQRPVFIAALLAAALIAGFFSTNPAATAIAAQHDGAALVRLMRFMDVVKTLLASAAAIAIIWRLAAPASLAWLAAYSVAGAALSAGPVLIWGLLHIGLGALLLHGGLVATLLSFWRDKTVGQRLDIMLKAKV